MALGDGARRNIATVTKDDRSRYRDAILTEIGDPWKTAVFHGGPGPYRDDNMDIPADPPQTVTRQVGAHANLVNPADEQTLLSSPDFMTFDNQMEGSGLNLHTQGHRYIGGTMLDPANALLNFVQLT